MTKATDFLTYLILAWRVKAFRLVRLLILLVATYTLILYSQTSATSPLRSCKEIFPSLERLDLSTFRAIATFVAETFNSGGKLLVSSSLGQGVAAFFEFKSIPCSSYLTVLVSALFWLIVVWLLIALNIYRSRRISQRPTEKKSTHDSQQMDKTNSPPDLVPGDDELNSHERRHGILQPVATAKYFPPPNRIQKQVSIEDELQALHALVGLQQVKDELSAVISLEKINSRRKAENLQPLKTSRHLVFAGNPGTGKTTVARLLGRIYAATGALSSGHVIETDRSGLVHPFIGQTARLTLQRVNEAKGGILFIDEAYTLSKNNAAHDTGAESIDTLLKAMEDYRDDLCVIVAGYTNEMRAFIESNPGLQSRFSKTIMFADYTPEELFIIFQKNLLEAGLKMHADHLNEVFLLINDAYEKGVTRKGNGRYIRNLVEASVERQAIRLDRTKIGSLSTILIDDVRLASSLIST